MKINLCSSTDTKWILFVVLDEIFNTIKLIATSDVKFLPFIIYLHIEYFILYSEIPKITLQIDTRVDQKEFCMEVHF